MVSASAHEVYTFDHKSSNLCTCAKKVHEVCRCDNNCSNLCSCVRVSRSEKGCAMWVVKQCVLSLTAHFVYLPAPGQQMRGAGLQQRMVHDTEIAEAPPPSSSPLPATTIQSHRRHY